MLWQKSPQYANMPHADYMRTEEGKRSQQAFQQWDQWRQNNMPTPSKPGPGRPSVPMTPSYSPGQAKPQQSPWSTSTKYGQDRPFGGNPSAKATGPGGAQPANRPPSLYGIYAPGATAEDISRAGPDALPSPNQQPANRPPPFQSTTRNFDGTTSQMPNFQQRDAFIAQINNQLGQMQQQSWQRPGMGAPQFNFPQMWGQAGKMAEQGFRNPFAAPAGRLVSQAALADIAPEYVGRPLPPLPPGAYY